ncbi:MAG: lytic transglycosylase domain-containing protein [Alphaproteobacteria bacterium]
MMHRVTRSSWRRGFLRPFRMLGVCLLLGSFALAGADAKAREVEVPISFDHALVQSLLVDQIFTGPDHSLVALRDAADCNHLVFTDPEVGAAEDGRLRITSAATARVGTPLGDQCMVVLDWSGFVETFHEARLDPNAPRVLFRTVDSRLLGPDREPASIAGTVWDWVKEHVHPRLDTLTLDLEPPLQDLQELLPLMLSVGDAERTARIVDSIRLSDVTVSADTITIAAVLDAPDTPVATPSEPEAPLTAEELARWALAWQQWDAFFTFIIKQSAQDTETRALRLALRDVLLEGRYDLVDILTGSPLSADAVPALFTKSWERLAPVLRSLKTELPGETALRYLSFIAAADALTALERLGPEIGVELSADGLRRLARIVAPSLPVDPLAREPGVDAELRSLMGFAPPIPLPSPAPGGGLFDWLLPSAQAAAELDAALVEKLNGIVPNRSNAADYLPLAKQLLDQTTDLVLADGKVGTDHHELFRSLMLAAAWQESCWRQFVRTEDGVEPLRSTVGSVGIMQVNLHVWRGFYDTRGLETDIGYNANAGAEILAHYLVDYAIAKGEDKVDLPDSLARATYAAYNGGPGHLKRYRSENAKRSLRAIDTAFYRKFLTVENGDKLAIIQCYQ